MARRSLDILSPTLGLYTDRPAIAVPRRGLSDARNVRIKNGRLCRERMGWERFYDIVLNGPPLLIETFRLRSGTHLLVLGTETDLYTFDGVTQTVSYLTPRYETGTATRILGLTAVGGVGTSWLANVKAGDEIHFGAAGQTDPDAEWHEIDSVTSNTILELVTPAAANSSGAYTIRKKFTGTNLDPWMSATYYGAPAPDYDRFFLTNGVDDVVWWDGSADQVTALPALNFTCRWLAVFKGMLIYGNITEAGEVKADVIRCSAIGDPENVTTDGAAELNATAYADILVAGKPLGDYLVTYGEQGTVNILQFVGPPIVFVVRTVSTKHGALSGRSVIDRGDFHEAVGVDGAYRFDGANAIPLGEQVLRDAMASLDPNRLAQALAYLDRERGEAIFVLPFVGDGATPETSYPQTAYLEFYREPVGDRFPTPFLPRDLPATAIGEYERDDTLRFSDIVESFISQGMRWNDRFLQAAFPVKLFGASDGSLYTLDSSDAQDGAAFTAFARFGRLPLADGTLQGFLSRIELSAEVVPDASYGLTVRVLGADRPESPGVERSSGEYALAEDGPRWIAPRVLARFVDIEIRTDGANESWSVSGLRAIAQTAGER